MPRGAANSALIRGFPNGGTHRPSWVGTGFGRGVRREVKHLSTCRKGYSVSSGERKRMMAKPCACDTRRGLRAGCCGIACAGSDGPAGSCRKPCVRGTGLNTGPQRVRAPYLNAHGLPIASPK